MNFCTLLMPWLRNININNCQQLLYVTTLRCSQSISVYKQLLYGYRPRRCISSTTILAPKQPVFKFPKKALRSWDILTTVLIFFGVIEDLEKTESPLILSIKRAILAKQRKEYNKAELILHTALQMAQDLSYTDAETYIFDIMADNCFEKEDFAKAKDLYLEVIGRLSVKKDFSHQSEELVELSTKLAYCYSRLGQIEAAEKGLQFAIDTQLLKTNKFWNDKSNKLLVEEQQLDPTEQNSLALLGMTFDYYSKHLQHQVGHLKYALAYKLKALQISQVVNGVEHEQTLVLENDLADLYFQLDDVQKAKDHLRNAINGARQIESAELPMYYLNMASLQCNLNRNDLAKSYCRQALDWLVKNGSDKEKISVKERKNLQHKCQLCLDGHKFY